MKKSLLAVAAVAFTLGSFSPAMAQPRKERPTGEQRLAKMLEGRTAGKPVSCIPAQISDRLQVIDETAVVYDGGRTIYVAKPRDPRSLDSDDILIINRFGSQLCKQDVIRTVDRTSGFMTGIVFLGDFVPYSRPGGRR